MKSWSKEHRLLSFTISSINKYTFLFFVYKTFLFHLNQMINWFYIHSLGLGWYLLYHFPSKLFQFSDVETVIFDEMKNIFAEWNFIHKIRISKVCKNFGLWHFLKYYVSGLGSFSYHLSFSIYILVCMAVSMYMWMWYELYD